MKRNIRALIHREDDGYVVEIPDINAVTQGDSLNDALENMKEVISLALDGEDPAQYGLVADPSVLVTLELGPLSNAV